VLAPQIVANVAPPPDETGAQPTPAPQPTASRPPDQGAAVQLISRPAPGDPSGAKVR
jgi:hypothetical protein